jgi:glycosyltransferase involved in cell wall biosynthesis
MACGTPVVATPQAISALTAVDGQHVLTGNQPSQIAHAILKLTNNPQLCKEIGDNGYQFVTKNHNWVTIVERLESYYQI